MGLRATLEKAHHALSAANVDHALIGGLGLATLGVHRATEDVDFLVDGKDRANAQSALERAGLTLSLATGEVLHFHGFGRVDILLANRPLSLEMLMQARVFPQHGIKCVLAEGLIGLKIQAYTNDKTRELQDKADIKALIDKSVELDWVKVKAYADLFGEWEFINSLRGK